ncbi:unnamed protein product [Acanthoscelides obtectus]|uniref:Zinc finger BED domain-containing protein 5 n=1 Tax=Acanthoscelides obtectus TaxID=200917 RepID=A0A9P0LDR1_ACAOB|nr:unnamed protein product [Acanthoscelides obtectus]CAK1626552.1 Protein ZBED8 [Acanthoscelides obtectus]
MCMYVQNVEKTITFPPAINQPPNVVTKRPTLDRMFASTSQRNDDGLRPSYYISLLIAKSGKPHTIGEKLILPAVEEVLKTVLHKPASDIIKRIPLSNNTVERRIDEMSSDIESFLCNYLQTTHFSIQLDESTLPDNAALLLAYVRFIMNQEIYEDLLFARTLITDTKGESIFQVLKDYFIETGILLSNIISVATDGAPAMSLAIELKGVLEQTEEVNAGTVARQDTSGKTARTPRFALPARQLDIEQTKLGKSGLSIKITFVRNYARCRYDLFDKGGTIRLPVSKETRADDDNADSGREKCPLDFGEESELDCSKAFIVGSVDVTEVDATREDEEQRFVLLGSR